LRVARASALVVRAAADHDGDHRDHGEEKDQLKDKEEVHGLLFRRFRFLARATSAQNVARSRRFRGNFSAYPSIGPPVSFHLDAVARYLESTATRSHA
jgi:hypothetical protein